MENKVDASKLNEENIYEGGSLTQIYAEDLVSNPIAIKQLINSHLLVAAQNKQKDTEIQSFISTIEYLKTSPFVAIIAGVVNVCGSIIIGVSVNLYTQTTPPKYSWIFLLIGGVLVLTGSFSNIFYPYARKWFNPQPKKKHENQ